MVNIATMSVPKEESKEFKATGTAFGGLNPIVNNLAD